MLISSQLNIVGATKTDFEDYQYINVFALVEAKNGVGCVTQMFKYHNLDDWKKFEHIQKGQIYPANCQVTFASKGKGEKGTDVEIESIEFIKQPVAQAK